MIAGMAQSVVQPFNDSGCTPAGVRYLFTQPGVELKRIVEDLYSQSDCIEPRHIENLRKSWPLDAVLAALAVAKAGKKAAEAGGKFPADESGNRIWALPEALEQATSRRVAQYKANQFRQWNPTAIIDFCCGIGGDALALANVAPVLAVELSPVRALLAAYNTAQMTHHKPLLVIQADAATTFYRPQSGLMFHIDPSRRSGIKRSAEFASMHPGPAVIEKIINQLHDGAIKLSPAVNFSDLPGGHLELISESGVVVQALLWTGRIAESKGLDTRTATVLSRKELVWSLTGKPGDTDSLCEPQEWLFEIDGAVLRAGLAPALCRMLRLQALNADGGYATGPEFIIHPALTGFKILTVLKYSERAVTDALQEHFRKASSVGKAAIEVKTRGGLGLDTDKLTQKWSALAQDNYTVLIYRGARGTTAIIAQRMIKSL